MRKEIGLQVKSVVYLAFQLWILDLVGSLTVCREWDYWYGNIREEMHCLVSLDLLNFNVQLREVKSHDWHTTKSMQSMIYFPS